MEDKEGTSNIAQPIRLDIDTVIAYLSVPKSTSSGVSTLSAVEPLPTCP